MRIGRPASLVVVLTTMVSTVLAGPTTAPASARPAREQPTAVAGRTPGPSGSTIPGDTEPSAQARRCRGVLHLGVIVTCPSISGDARHVYRVTTFRNSDKLFTQLTQGSGDFLSAQVNAPDGTFLCSLRTSGAGTCQLGAAGTYTLVVSLSFGGTNNYTVAVESMRTPSSCTTLSNSFFSFASPGRMDTLPAGAAANCYRFNQPVGSVLHLVDPGGPADVQGEILDAQFQPLCTVRDTRQCTLSRPGPYRLFLVESSGTEITYTLRMPRISHSVGCPVLALAPFGDPGTAAGTETIVELNDVTCHKWTPATGGLVAVRINPEQDLQWTLYDVNGQRVCERFAVTLSCRLPEGGEYTLLVEKRNFVSEPITYRVAMAALFRDGGCAAVTGTSWDLPALLVHQTSPVQTNCHPVEGRAGDRIITYAAPTVFNEAITWLVDSTGAIVCPGFTGEDGCVLPADGTYRVVSYLHQFDDGTADATYAMQVRQLSDPVGCPDVRPGAYGAAPAGAPGGIRCRILDIPAAGIYLVKAVDAENFDTFGQVYDPAGVRLPCGTPACAFATPGRYTMVLQGSSTSTVIDNGFQYATVLLSMSSPSGCAAVSDTGYLDAPHRGGFVTAGQHDCLQLPSPAGARIIELQPGDAIGAGRPFVTIVDASGSFVCDSFSLRQFTCELVGTGPFVAILGTGRGQPIGTYAIAFARTDGAPACPVLPRTAEGSTVATGGDRFAVCFSVPADQHAAVESFTYRRTTGAGDASLSVFDGTGLRFCGPTSPSINRTFSCRLPEGPATVILVTSAADAAYQLTHRDASTPVP